MQLGKTGGFLESVTDCEWLQQPLLITRQLLGSQIREGFRFKSYNQVNIDERVSSTTRLCDSVQLVLLPYESEGSEHLCCRPATTTSQFLEEFLNLSSTRSWLDATRAILCSFVAVIQCLITHRLHLTATLSPSQLHCTQSQ